MRLSSGTLAGRTDPTLRPAMRAARWAGVVGLIALSGVSVGDAPVTRGAILLVGALIAGALGRRARRGGLPTGDVIAVALTTLALSAAISVGVVITVAFGACLLALNSRK